MKKGKWLLSVLMVVVMAVCAGCATSGVEVEIGSNGKVTVTETTLLQRDVVDKVMSALAKDPETAASVTEIYDQYLDKMEKVTEDGVEYYKSVEPKSYNSYSEAEKELKDKVDLSGADIAADHIYMAMYLEKDVSGYNSGMLSQYESVLTGYGFTVEEVQQLLAAVTIKVNVSFENAVTYCDDAATIQGKTATWTFTQDSLANYGKGLHVFYAETMTESKIKTDKTAPVVSGVANKGYYKNKSVKVKDNTGVAVVLVDGKQAEESFKLNTYAQGKRTIVAYDFSGNKKNVTFTYDNTKPTVSGVKNKITYKKAVKIKYADKYGVKAATLNGKKFKSGKKVSKKGSYTVKVTDKAGNSTVVKFKIKK